MLMMEQNYGHINKEAGEARSIKINVVHAYAQMRKWDAFNKSCESAFSSLNIPYLSLVYEEDFAEDKKVKSKTFKYLEVEPIKLNDPLQRTNPYRLEELIENYDEMMDYLTKKNVLSGRVKPALFGEVLKRYMDKLGMSVGKKNYSMKSTIAWITKQLLRFPLLTLLFFLSVAASVYMQTLSSVYLGYFFETLKLGDDKGMLRAVLLVLVVLTSAALLQWISTLSVLNIRLKVEKNIRNEIFSAFLNKKHDYLNTARTGDLLSIGTNELRSISVMFQPGLIMSLRSILFYFIPLFFLFLRGTTGRNGSFLYCSLRYLRCC